MWNGDVCCAATLDPSSKAPDFSSLALLPREGCNSPTAQFIAQGLCLGMANCTLQVTYYFEVYLYLELIASAGMDNYIFLTHFHNSETPHSSSKYSICVIRPVQG